MASCSEHGPRARGGAGTSARTGTFALSVAVTAALLASSVAAGQPREAGGETLRGELSISALAVGSRDVSVENAVVFLENGPSGDAGQDPPFLRGPFRLAQKAKAFRPAVLIVPRGAEVAFPNEDVLTHNVFSVTPGASFDLGLYKPGQSRSITFDQPGIVSVFCNIHPQMLGFIVVVSNPAFTHPRADGGFELRGLPPGDYRLVAWYPFAPPLRETVHVEPGKTPFLRLVLRERGDVTRHPDKHGNPYGQY